VTASIPGVPTPRGSGDATTTASKSVLRDLVSHAQKIAKATNAMRNSKKVDPTDFFEKGIDLVFLRKYFLSTP